jgi:cyclase
MAIKKSVRAISKRKNAEELLNEITIEDCGKSRVYLGGLAQTLHERNLRSLLYSMS